MVVRLAAKLNIVGGERSRAASLCGQRVMIPAHRRVRPERGLFSLGEKASLMGDGYGAGGNSTFI